MFDIGQFLVKSRQSAVSIDRLVEFDKVPAMVRDKGTLPCDENIQGHLQFANVSFGFPGADRKIIDSVSLEIRPGQTAALVGKIGSGKSWLASMIPRLVDPIGGVIKLDGHDLREYRLEELRRKIGYVPQEPVLFSDTVRNNILFGRHGMADSAIKWAIEVSQLESEISNFPNGLNTQIGTRGVSLSGGQKQRLALARALIGNPKILILDDCTSALDSHTETALWERLEKVMPDLTVILVTHRPDMLKKTDIIFVMDDGRIMESGAHYELMPADGRYASLYKRFQLEQQISSVT